MSNNGQVAAVPIGCFFCNNTGVPIDWSKEIKQYVCKKCAKAKRLVV